MTRERLEGLRRVELEHLADEYGVDASESTDRSELVDLVHEAIEEARLEREATNSYAVRIEERKYDLLADELRDLPEAEDSAYELPERYNETRIELLLRDPAWAYAYWDLNDAVQEQLQNDPEFGGLALRIVEADSPVLEEHRVVDSLEIPVQFQDDRWYVNLPRQQTNYYVELVAYGSDGREVLCRSRSVTVPRGGLSEEGLAEAEEMVIALSGADDLGVPSFGRRIPQRIIQLVDSYEIE